MSDKVVPLQKNAPIQGDTRPLPLVVETLEQLLADARSGRIRHIAAIVWIPGRRKATISVGEIEGDTVMGACDVLKLRVFNLTQMVENEEGGG